MNVSENVHTQNIQFVKGCCDLKVCRRLCPELKSTKVAWNTIRFNLLHEIKFQQRKSIFYCLTNSNSNDSQARSKKNFFSPLFRLKFCIEMCRH